MSENVLCIQEAFTHKYMQDKKFIDFAFIDDFHTFTMYFRPRSETESDERFKQIIPYILIKSGQKYFVFNRGKGGGESRLSDKFSLGIGGHINDQDLNILTGVCREVFEELGRDVYHAHFADMLCEYTPRNFIPFCKGFIYDDSNSVGRVHLGMLYELKVDYDFIPSGEIKEQCQWNRWLSRQDILELGLVDKLETWSQIVLRDYIIKQDYEYGSP